MIRNYSYLVTGALIGSLVFGIGLRIAKQKSDPAESVTTVSLPTTQPTNNYPSEELYQLISGFRSEQNLPNLQVNRKLEASAQLKLSEMIANHYYRHEDTTGQQSWHFFKQVNYHYVSAGENLAFNINTPWQVLDSWQQSSTHRAQLLNPNYTDMGIAVDCQALAAYADGGCITVLHLGSE